MIDTLLPKPMSPVHEPGATSTWPTPETSTLVLVTARPLLSGKENSTVTDDPQRVVNAAVTVGSASGPNGRPGTGSPAGPHRTCSVNAVWPLQARTCTWYVVPLVKPSTRPDAEAPVDVQPPPSSRYS